MLNVVALMGRLVADPELRHTPNGVATCTFRIAVDRSFVRAGEERKADFIDIVVWRQTAEFVCKYFHKGNLIAVDGSIQTRTYEDKTGNKRYAFEVVANNVHFTGEKSGSTGGRGRLRRARAHAGSRRASRARRARQLCGRQRRRFRRDRRQRRSTVLRRRTCPARPFRYFETRRKTPCLSTETVRIAVVAAPVDAARRFAASAWTVSTTLTIKTSPACASTFPSARRSFPAALPVPALSTSVS